MTWGWRAACVALAGSLLALSGPVRAEPSLGSVLRQIERAVVGLVPGREATAEPTAACETNYFGGRAPRVLHQPLAEKTRELCSPGYAVLHSGVSRTPLWSAEHLTRERVKSAIQLSREDSFRPDLRLPHGERAELQDYARSGWDRGHLSPNKDMPDRVTQRATFLLSNMIPQAPRHNQQLWEGIEHATRSMVLMGEEAYVVTGPSFLGNVKRTGRVLIPTHVWKAVLLPQSGRAGAWWTSNVDPEGSRDWELISIDELATRTGIDPFPALSGPIRAAAARFVRPPARPRAAIQQD